MPRIEVPSGDLLELARDYGTNSLVPATSSPGMLAQMISREIALWAPVIQSLGIRPE